MPNEIKCVVCKNVINFPQGDSVNIAEIRRGWYYKYDITNGEDEHGHDYCNNIKFQRFICHECFLNDPDLCRFMNKIGCLVR